MLQELIALLVIVGFIFRLSWQYHRGLVPKSQLVFWLIFWLLTIIAILNLKKLDALAENLGFSSSGIELLLYAAIAVIFYALFRLRLKTEKMEESITVLTRALAFKQIKEKTKEQKEKINEEVERTNEEVERTNEQVEKTNQEINNSDKQSL